VWTRDPGGKGIPHYDRKVQEAVPSGRLPQRDGRQGAESTTDWFQNRDASSRLIWHDPGEYIDRSLFVFAVT
jgi:hypothetical protein